ncbi:hypothetical protein [Paenibacillus macerans]|uniref:hypothetical protein n=1 Tax=Paenibacillus macerans TaxID=44252 RepID=UPI0022DF3923|nr:hypothetical protein [Paenibacillus macerans]
MLDGGRYLTLAPERDSLSFDKGKTTPDYFLRYFTKDSPKYKLNEFLYNEDNLAEKHGQNRLFEVVILFEDELEKIAFLGYIHSNKKVFLDKFNSLEEYYWIDEEPKRKQYLVECLKTGKVLNQMLSEYRQMQM